ncbi:MAG: 1-acyl-sn-glycerol-3-phosphate acyltransferase [Myxococcales bacterium]|nr:acyltransferase [Myxococcales bacterium]HIK84126.1 acyltransferase [Myxococcales bacterium]
MRKRPVRRLLARILIAVTGWKPDGVRPEPKKFVLIAAPHTTNWDFIYLIAFAALFEIEISWMGKHTLFRWPFGFFARALGGVPVHRNRSEKMVTAMARTFDEHEELGLVVPAEGTRGYVEYWKSGFYHIAMTARVPIVMSYLDYTQKMGGFGPAFFPAGDPRQDMDTIRAFYEGRQGKHPELFGQIRLREEDSPTP